MFLLSVNHFIMFCLDSMLDGTPTLRMNEFVLAALDKGKIPLDLVQGEKPGAVQVEEVEFVVDATVKQHVETAKQAFTDVIKQHDLKVRLLGAIKILSEG
jgi:carnitine O-acetyltransferase